MKKIIIYYFLFLLSFFSFFSSGMLDSTDGLQYLAVARNIYYLGEPTAPVYEYATRENLHLSSFVALNGKTYSMTGLGYSLAYLPAVFVSDMVYKIYNVAPPQKFPLQSDWVILFTASFTNAFFGAGLGVILFVFFILLGINKRQAFVLGFISLVGTNLFVYTKHSFAHMSFIFFMMLTFLMIKIYSIKKQKKFLVFAGLSFGVLSIVYNLTFILTLVPLILYFVFLTKPKVNKAYPEIFKNISFGVLGLLPFIIIYFWYESLRALPEQNFVGKDFYINYAAHTASFPITVFIEGIHGQLFSPGRSIFIYSPILLIIGLFWMKFKSIFKPELIAFMSLSIIYIIFYALQYRIGSPDQGIVANWHGELSWGPRYLTPLIPLGMLIVGVIYKELTNKIKYLVFYPLVLIGLLIELLGVLIPYQIKLHDMQQKFFLNGTEYFSALYSDFLPRYNPIYNMSKKFIKLPGEYKRVIDNGPYNIKYYDGIDFSFPVGGERWRAIENTGYISFDNNSKNPIKNLTVGLINHPIEVSSESAKLTLNLNEKDLSVPIDLRIAERKFIKLNLPGDLLKPVDNKLKIHAQYKTPMEIKFPLNQNVTVGRKQILGLLSFDINDQRQNLESINVPFVSSLGPVLTHKQYQNWGEDNKDLWKIWEIHTQTFERLPDIWWIRNLVYWDIPKNWIVALFLINLITLLLSGYKLVRVLKN